MLIEKDVASPQQRLFYTIFIQFISILVQWQEKADPLHKLLASCIFIQFIIILVQWQEKADPLHKLIASCINDSKPFSQSYFPELHGKGDRLYHQFRPAGDIRQKDMP